MHNLQNTLDYIPEVTKKIGTAFWLLLFKTLIMLLMTPNYIILLVN